MKKESLIEGVRPCGPSLMCIRVMLCFICVAELKCFIKCNLLCPCVPTQYKGVQHSHGCSSDPDSVEHCCPRLPAGDRALLLPLCPAVAQRWVQAPATPVGTHLLSLGTPPGWSSPSGTLPVSQPPPPTSANSPPLHLWPQQWPLRVRAHSELAQTGVAHEGEVRLPGLPRGALRGGVPARHRAQATFVSAGADGWPEPGSVRQRPPGEAVCQPPGAAGQLDELRGLDAAVAPDMGHASAAGSLPCEPGSDHLHPGLLPAQATALQPLQPDTYGAGPAADATVQQR